MQFVAVNTRLKRESAKKYANLYASMYPIFFFQSPIHLSLYPQAWPNLYVHPYICVWVCIYYNTHGLNVVLWMRRKTGNRNERWKQLRAQWGVFNRWLVTPIVRTIHGVIPAWFNVPIEFLHEMWSCQDWYIYKYIRELYICIHIGAWSLLLFFHHSLLSHLLYIIICITKFIFNAN